jgi:hypothetical protein
MFTSKMRHWVVALGLVAVVGVTGASAAGFVNHARHTGQATTESGQAPVVSGDLGEVVIHAPNDLGEVVVFAPHDLGNVLVEARRTGAAPAYLAEIVVTAPRDDREIFATAGTATLVAAR